MERGALHTTSQAHNRVFAISLNAVDIAELDPTDLSLVVRCSAGQDTVRYQVLVTETELQMEMGIPLHGEVWYAGLALKLGDSKSHLLLRLSEVLSGQPGVVDLPPAAHRDERARR